MGCKIAQVILIVCLVALLVFLMINGPSYVKDMIFESNNDTMDTIQDFLEKNQKKITAEYKPYTDFYLEYSDFSDIEKSSDLVQQKILEYNAWFLEKQKSFVLGELSEQEEKILEKIELIQNNPQLRKDNQNE